MILLNIRQITTNFARKSPKISIMKIKNILITALTILTASCDNELDTNNIANTGWDNSHLTISTITTHNSTKALIEDDYLPATSAIGITVLNTEGTAYDNIDYQNIRFEAEGTGATQKWQGDATIYLSATEGYCYGYYPYSLTANDITQIPVSTASQTDYLYATPKQVDINNKNVNLNMKHALSAIRLALKRGTYTGTGKITAVSVTSSGLGTTGILNATTGKVTASGTGAAIAVTTDIDLTTTEQNADIIVVPTGNEATLTLTATIDGKAYMTPASAITIEQGKCYTYTVTIDAGKLSLSGVKVGDWGYDDGGAPTIEAAGYKVTFAGDYEGISFSNNVNEAAVRIEAHEKNGWQVKAVSISGDAILSQAVSGDIYIINLLAIKSDVVITFNGTDNPWNDLADGVYAVGADLRPVAMDDATSECIAAAIVNSDTGQKLMIEKYEEANASYAKSFTDWEATNTTYLYCFYWGVYGQTMNSILNIPDYKKYTQANSTYNSGYLPDKNGKYAAPQNNLGLPSEWPTDATQFALADKNGYLHSQYLMQVAMTDGETEYPKMGQLLKTFLASSDALGYSDWFIPACAQLSLFWVYRSDINTVLTAIGGTKLNTTASYYWTSTEYNMEMGWCVGMHDGGFCYRNKNSVYNVNAKYRVRLVREL